MKQEMFIRNGFIDINADVKTIEFDDLVKISTIVSNIAHYGYALDLNAVAALSNHPDLNGWWKANNKIFKTVSGEDRNMQRHVVFKNFPREVLKESSAISVAKQIAIYLGVDYDSVREDEEERPPLGNLQSLKVLKLANEKTAQVIFEDLKKLPNRWSDNQVQWAKEIFAEESRNYLSFADFAFKENGIALAAAFFNIVEIEASSSTDVLRLCAAVSGAISIKDKVRFTSFKRAARRRVLTMLESQTNLAEDFALRRDLWKRLLERLRPGDYKSSYPKTVQAYDDLYHHRTQSFNQSVNLPSLDALTKLKSRPGEFVRRFHQYYAKFPTETTANFVSIVSDLTTKQLLSFGSYLSTINNRKTFLVPPKSNWSRVQLIDNKKVKIKKKDIGIIEKEIAKVLGSRLQATYPDGLMIDDRVENIKFQTNDQKLAEYGRGTVFDIPSNINFLRSASYWEHDGAGVTWYDNGWNLFDSNWKSVGTVGWDNQQFPRSSYRNKLSEEYEYAGIYSGDPVNTKDLKGRACQMADLYIDRLIKHGVRYAVWNILCYSKQKFSDAKEVLATLQMGEDAVTGKLYEPSRAQLIFPLKSDNYTSYVAYVDLLERKLVYMDAPLPCDVYGTSQNAEKLEKLLPAYLEYLDSLPSVLDLVKHAKSGSTPIVYDDRNIDITSGSAFVFNPLNTANSYNKVSLVNLINV